jgi:hypothetical protein
MGWKQIGSAVLLLGAAACSGQSVEPTGASALLEAQAGDTVRLGFGHSARVGNITIVFRGIGEDSRCPIDAVCVWAGTAEALLDLSTGNGSSQRVHLHTLREPDSTEYGQYRIRLLDVQPAARSERTIAATEYSVRLEITAR